MTLDMHTRTAHAWDDAVGGLRPGQPVPVPVPYVEHDPSHSTLYPPFH